jgi:signal transduction histidine kinase
MSRLIEDLTSYSRLDRAEPLAQPVRIQDCIHLAMQNLDLTIREKNADILLQFDAPDAQTQGNAAQIAQLFQNLLANAIKFCDKERPVIRVELAADGNDNWQVTVKDNGIGFDEQFKDQIFLIFKRLHHTEQKYPGTGMGLAISKKVVEQHKGRIRAESILGQGSSFIVTLPRLNGV